MRKGIKFKVGKQIKAIRQQRRLEKEELARLAGISERYLRKIEAGHNPGIKTIARIIKVLDIKIEALLGGD